jgi:hypothetical protein
VTAGMWNIGSPSPDAMAASEGWRGGRRRVGCVRNVASVTGISYLFYAGGMPFVKQ